MPLPHDSEAQDLQLQVMAAAAEPAHRLRLLLHHRVWAPAPPLSQWSMRGPQDEMCAHCGRSRHTGKAESGRCTERNLGLCPVMVTQHPCVHVWTHLL